MNKNILLIHIAGIGDFIEALRSIKAVKEWHKESRLVLLVSDKIYHYAKKLPFVDEVYEWKTNKGRAFSLRGVKNYIKTVMNLKRYNFDLFINFQEIASVKGMVLMMFLEKFLRPKVSVGRNTSGRGKFFDIKLGDNFDMKKSQSEFYMELVKLAGVENVPQRIEFLYNFSFEKELNFSLDKVVGFGIGSEWKSRLWEVDSFVKVIKYFRKRNYYILLFGVNREFEYGQQIIRSFENEEQKYFVNFCGKTTLEELIWLVSKCKVVVATNSLVMHIAANVGVPVVGLIGAGNPYRDRPYGDGSKMSLLWKSVGCNPCYYYECPLKTDKMKCMKLITPEEVVERVRVYIGN